MTEAEKVKNPMETKGGSETQNADNKTNTDILKELCVNNADFFTKDSTENGQRLYISFLSIIDSIDLLRPKVVEIKKRCAEFDFDEKTPGNGYRSFLQVYNMAVKHAIDLNQKIMYRRNSVLFRKTLLTKEIESCSHLITSLDTCFKHLQTMMTWSSNGDLFAEDRPLQDLIEILEDVNQYCFYGRTIGFQFCESLRNVLQFIALSMAIFSEAYYSQGSLFSKATNSVVTTTKYITDPEQRARQIVNISQNAGIDFCKAFWFLSESELMNQLPSVVSPTVAVCKVISIAPEPFSIEVDGKQIDVPVPMSYLGPKPVQMRLISHKMRKGMLGTKNKEQLEPPSGGIIIHCHGGGFVAQSSKSHEGYLRDWAKHLDVPIISIDYSLAPEAPFPRALEEVLYAYCWVLKNHQFLGSTGQRIVAAGDSAGANLLLTATLKCLSQGIPPPDGIFVAYAPTLVKFVLSPARFLCMMDPLLPFGFLVRCLNAYACPNTDLQASAAKDNAEGVYGSDTESFEEISESDLADLQAHKSPVSDASDTLTYGSMNSNVEEITSDEIRMSVEVEKSQKYVSEVLQKYVLEPDPGTDGGTRLSLVDAERSSASPVTATSTSSTLDNSLQSRLSSFVSNLRESLSKLLGNRLISGAQKYFETEKSCLWDEVASSSVPSNPYLSPYYASDDQLKMFPPTRILTVQLDPCLDDCVMFARRLKNINKDVHLDILQGLPHGFLNFSLISKDAYEGSKVCVQRIRELLNLDSLGANNEK